MAVGRCGSRFASASTELRDPGRGRAAPGQGLSRSRNRCFIRSDFAGGCAPPGIIVLGVAAVEILGPHRERLSLNLIGGADRPAYFSVGATGETDPAHHRRDCDAVLLVRHVVGALRLHAGGFIDSRAGYRNRL